MVDVPVLRNDEETLEERLTDNAYDRILPARYLSEGETQEDLFKRVGRNIAVAEAIHTDEDVTITRSEIKPDHPRRDELFGEVFDGKEIEVAMTEENAKHVAYEPLVERLEAEGHDDALNAVESYAEEFVDAQERLKFIPNSPTLMNAGDELQQLAACFVHSPDDDMEDIHEVAKDAALTFQSGGGMGYGFSKLRPYGDQVGSTDGIASGPITFMRTFDQLCETIAQGGARRGAQMTIMECWHPDIISFIHAKDPDVSLAVSLRLNDADDPTHNTFSSALEEARDVLDQHDFHEDASNLPSYLRNAIEGHLSNFNMSVGVTDEFMQAVKADEEFTFKNPKDEEPHTATPETVEIWEQFGYGEHVEAGEVLSVPARKVWRDMIEGAHQNGEPGCVFIERINNKHSFDVEEHPEKRIWATNPCGEEPLIENEACNLGHINLSTVVEEGIETWDEFEFADPDASLEDRVDEYVTYAIDTEELDYRIDLGSRFLDNVITMSNYPTDDIEHVVSRTRKTGLGIMGLAQMYVQLGVAYGSDVGDQIANEMMRRISHGAKNVSHELAKERGVFGEWENSKWSDPTEYAEWITAHSDFTPKRFDDGILMRNHKTTEIAPTGTTSMVANTSGGCEPMYNVAYLKNVSDDVQGEEELVEFDELFLETLRVNDIDVSEVKQEAADLLMSGEFEGPSDLETVPQGIADIFVVSGALSAADHLGVQCALQDHVDAAISKTVNAPNDATVDDATDTFELAYDNGAKGCTYYRQGSRSVQVLATEQQGADEEEEEAESDDESLGISNVPTLRASLSEDEEWLVPSKVPDVMEAVRYRVDTSRGTLHVQIVHDDENRPVEVYAELGKSGTETASFVEALGKMVSTALRTGVHPREIVDQLRRIESGNIAWHNGRKVTSIADGVSYALEQFLSDYSPVESYKENIAIDTPDSSVSVVDSGTSQTTTADGGSDEKVGSNERCPECGEEEVYMSEGCKTCEICGWSKCS
jgi:ribonucleoside-diphosphate reductase alpha chain